MFAGVCEEGGEMWLRYLVKGYKSGSTKAGIKGLENGEWKVTVSNMGSNNKDYMPVFLITAKNRLTNNLRYWTISLKQDQWGNFEFDQVTEGTSLDNSKFQLCLASFNIS